MKQSATIYPFVWSPMNGKIILAALALFMFIQLPAQPWMSREDKVKLEALVLGYINSNRLNLCTEGVKNQLVIAIRDSLDKNWNKKVYAGKTDLDIKVWSANYLQRHPVNCWTETQKNAVKNDVQIFLKQDYPDCALGNFINRTSYEEFKQYMKDWSLRSKRAEDLSLYFFGDNAHVPPAPVQAKAVKTGTWQFKKYSLYVGSDFYQLAKTTRSGELRSKSYKKVLAPGDEIHLPGGGKWRVKEINPDRVVLKKKWSWRKREFRKISSAIDSPQLVAESNTDNWIYFKDYTPAQKALIKDHWKQFFKDDIHRTLSPKLPIVPVKLDSYGCIYPPQSLLTGLGDRNFAAPALNDINLFKYSMYNIFRENKDAISGNIAGLNDEAQKKFYRELLNLATNNENIHDNKDKFNDLWQEHDAEKMAAGIKETMKALHKKTLLFFVHGYNVPYSLANIQAIELMKLLSANGIDTAKILLAPVFWSSNSAKKLNLDDEAHFTTKNTISLSNGIGYLHYSNRAYFASNTLRRLLNEFEKDSCKILVFSHSLGATVVTSAIMNTYSKLDYRSSLKDHTDSETWTETQDLEYKCKEQVNYYLVKNWNKTPVRYRNISFFMSAPAIPGQYTFVDLPKDKQSYLSFYSTVNRQDEMLTKNAIPAPYINSGNMSSSTLGCDYNGEAAATRALFENPLRFIYKETSSNEDHDILTYMRQPGYVAFVTLFFNSH